MRIFVTGGTGYFGSTLVEHLVAAGHAVTGLARSDRSAEALESAGATPVRGALADTAVLEEEAARADATVHAAVDYAMTEESEATELAAVSALVRGAAAAGAGTPVLYTSTGLVYGFDPAQDRTEEAELPAASAQPMKAAAERVVREAPGITAIVFRPGLIYGRGGSGLVTGLIGSASASGVATYVGDGSHAWTPVHVDDLADLYVRALEHPVAGVYNAAGPHPFAFRELAEAIAALAGTSVASVPLDAARDVLGPLALVLAAPGAMSAEKAARTFGWRPGRPSLLEDVRSGSYSARAGSRPR